MPIANGQQRISDCLLTKVEVGLRGERLAGFVRAERVAEHGRGLDNTGMR
jgi:hypothetical protein